jgi:WD40 repeat protein
MEIGPMLTRVTADVLAKTKNAQKPQVLSGLAKEFYFKQQGEEEQFAYKQEIETLRAKVALLERQPAQEAQFDIVSSEARNKQQSPVTDVAHSAANTAGTSPSVADADSKNPAKHNSPVPTSTGPPDRPAQPSSPETSTKEETAATQQPTSNPPGGAIDTALNKQEPKLVVSVNLDQTTIVRKLRIAPNGKLLAIGSDDGIVRIVNLDTFEIIQTIHAHTGRVSDIDFAPDSQTLLSAGRDGSLRFWNASNGQKVRADLQVSGSVPYSARFNPVFPDRYVLMGDKEGRLLAWDLAREGKLIVNSKFHNGPVQSVAYQPGGKGAYLSAGADGLLKVRLPEGQRYVANAHAGTIFAAGYNHSGDLIYTAGYDRKIKIWNSATLNRNNPSAVLEGHLKYVLTAAISEDGKLLASGGGDKAVDLWDVASRKLIGRLLGHTSDIEALEFTPNNRFVISSSEDRTVRIWSVDSYKELVRMFFRNDSGKFAGVTYDNKSFGDKDAGVMTVFIDGRAVAGSKAEDALTYIGHGISIVNAQR